MALKLLGSLESSGGNVGIGTASPSSKLHIVTGTPTGAASPSSDVPLLIDSNGNQFIEFRTRSAATGLMQGTLYSDNGKNAFIGYKEYTGAVANTYGESIHIALKNFTASDAGSGIYLGTTSDPTLGVTNPIMFLKGNGNVGIGTTSPVRTFVVDKSNSGSTGGYIRIQNEIGGSGSNVGIDFATYSPQYYSSTLTSTDPAAQIKATDTGSYAGRLDVLVRGTGTGGTLSTVATFNNNGYVGIGTTSPNEKLTVAGNIHAYAPSGINAGLFASTAAGATSIAIRSSGVTFFNAGNVGIGTASPAQKLHVVGTSNFQGAVQVASGTFVDSARRNIYIDSFSAGGGAGIFFRDGFSYNASITAEDHNGSSADGICISGYDGVSFSTGANTRQERMRIALDGNVGIGATSPIGKLHIDNPNTSANQLALLVNQSDSSSAIANFYQSGIQTHSFTTTGTNSGIIQIKSGGNNIVAISASGNSYFNGGNVGIGTTAPATKLNIALGSGGTNGVAGLRIGGTSNYASLELGTYGAYGGMVRSYGNDLHYFSGHWRTIGNTASENHSHYWYTSKSGSSDWSTVKMELDHDGNLGIGTMSPATRLHVNGVITATSGTSTNWNTAYGWGNHGSAGYLTAATAATTYAPLASPAAPTNLSLSVVNDTVNVTFTASATSGIDSYFVFSSVAGGDYSLISMIAPDDFGATMSIIDNAFDATGTQAYRVYAVKNGIISADLTGSISYSVTSPLEPTNMSVVNLNTAFYVQWDAPSANARFVTAYNVYKHEHATESSLARSSATLIYSGNNYSYMYQISGNDNNNFHKFWVETTVV